MNNELRQERCTTILAMLFKILMNTILYEIITSTLSEEIMRISQVSGELQPEYDGDVVKWQLNKIFLSCSFPSCMISSRCGALSINEIDILKSTS